MQLALKASRYTVHSNELVRDLTFQLKDVLFFLISCIEQQIPFYSNILCYITGTWMSHCKSPHYFQFCSLHSVCIVDDSLQTLINYLDIFQNRFKILGKMT